jgi:hypothetical protein
MKQPTIPVVIDQPQSSTDAKVTEVQSVPLPAVAVPIPVRRKPASLPASGENSYIEDKRDPDLLQRFEKLEIKEEENESDEDNEQSKFGIAWVASDDFEDYEGPRGCISLVLLY